MCNSVGKNQFGCHFWGPLFRYGVCMGIFGPKMVKNGQNGQKRPKRAKTAKNGQKRPKMAQNGLKWPKMAKIRNFRIFSKKSEKFAIFFIYSYQLFFARHYIKARCAARKALDAEQTFFPQAPG